MFNLDEPAFPFALLAILVVMRLVLTVTKRYLTPPLEAAPLPLAPDDVVDEPALDTAPAAPQALDEDAAPPARFFTELLDSGIIAVVLVFFLIRPFILQAFFIPTGSMLPTLQEGDKLLATKYVYHLREPRRGEVVVFNAPAHALEMANQPNDARQPVDYVKRVIGLPGDRVRVVSNMGVYVNGKLLPETYPHAMPEYDYPMNAYGDLQLDAPEVVRNEVTPHIVGRELLVPPGYLFVLGDNRNLSLDSHRWGLLARNRVVGKAVFIFWPPSRAGMIR